MKKNTAPKKLATILLLTIAVLAIVAGNGSLKEALSNSNSTVLPPTSAEEEPVESTPIIDFVEGELPLLPSSHERFEFIQTITSDSNIRLEKTLYTSENIYIVFSHQTSQGTFAVEAPTTTILALDFSGTIVSFLHVNHVGFLACQTTADGLVLALCDKQITYLYTISTDLKSTMLIELNKCEKGRIFALNNGFLWLEEGVNNTIYSIKNNTILYTSSISAGEIVEVYDFYNYFTFIINGINGYTVLNTDRNFELLSSKTFPEKKVVCLQPFVNNNEQNYIVAELINSQIVLTKYNKSWEEYERISVGIANSAEVFMNNDSIFLLLHASTDRLYLIDGNFNYTATNSTLMNGITELYDVCSDVNGFTVFYKDIQLCTFTIKNDGGSSVVNLQILPKSAFGFTRSNNMYIAYQEGNSISFTCVK